MQISAIEVIPLVCKLDTEFLGGTYKITNRNTIVTRVHLANGVVGECFGGDEDQTQQRIVALMRDHLIPLLIGEDVHDIERLWEKMFFCDVDLGNRALHVLDLGNRGVLMQAIAAIDNALWGRHRQAAQHAGLQAVGRLSRPRAGHRHRRLLLPRRPHPSRAL